MGCKSPVIIGTEDKTVYQGADLDLMDGVVGYDSNMDEIEVTTDPSELDMCDVGEHEVIYSASGVDSSQKDISICVEPKLYAPNRCKFKTVYATRMVNIEQAPPPTIDGIDDTAINVGASLDLMDGVSATDVNGNELEVSYSGVYDLKAEGAIASFVTDLEAPLKLLRVTLEPIQHCTPWIGTEEDTTPYVMRALSEVDTEVGNREYDTLVGGTVCWNQLVQIPSSNKSKTANNVTITDNRDGSYTIQTTSAGASANTDVDIAVGGASVKVKQNHVYLKAGALYSKGIYITDAFLGWNVTNADAKLFKTSASDNETYVTIRVMQGSVITSPIKVYPNVIDLTALFGTTIADHIYSLEQANAGAGVAFFRKYFNKDYYAYNAGELMSVNAVGHKMRDANDNVIGNYALDDITLRGIPKLDNGNLYYDGDEYKSDGSVTRKYGIVDLGTLTWTTRKTGSTNKIVSSSVQSYGNYVPLSVNAICEKYDFVGYSSAAELISAVETAKIGLYFYNAGSYDYTVYLVIPNNATPSGLMAYSLKDPTTETADPFTNPQICDPNGTEEYIDGEVQDGNRDVSIPVGHKSTYSLVCPIGGYDEVTVTVADDDTNPTESEEYTTTLPTTVYGGKLDLVSGRLVVDRASVDLGSLNWSTYSASPHTRFGTTGLQATAVRPSSDNVEADMLSDRYTIDTSTNLYNLVTDGTIGMGTNGVLYCYDAKYLGESASTAVANFKTAVTGSQLVYPLATPQTYQLTPQQINTLLGSNFVWSEMGEVEVIYSKSTDSDEPTFEVGGLYDIIYTATDKCGNKAEVTRQIQVGTFRTVLYNDGTFIINEPSDRQAENTAMHGGVKAVYDPFDANHDYVFEVLDGYYKTTNAPWESERENVTRIEIGSPISPTDTSYWFVNMYGAEYADVSKLDTSNVKYMTSMFDGCGSLKELDLSTFDVSNVENTLYMLYHCNDIEKLDITGWVLNDANYYAWTDNYGGASQYIPNVQHFILDNVDTSQMTTMNSMFRGLSMLEEVNLSSFDTSNVTDMTSMFSGCSSLQELDVSAFDTSRVEYMGSMFSQCESLSELDVSNFDTSRVYVMSFMFYGLTVDWLTLCNFDTSSVESMQFMFAQCYNLEGISVEPDLFVTSNVTIGRDMFLDCVELVGGNNTAYDANHIDVTYAVVDGHDGAVGYFSYCR